MTTLDTRQLNAAGQFAPPRPLGLNDWRWTALHEAGHVVAAAAAGLMPEHVCMSDDGEGMTNTPGLPTLPPAQLAVAHLCGMAAEARAGSADCLENGKTDRERVHRLAIDVVGSEEPELTETIMMAWDAALEFVRVPAVWGAIEEVAAFLLIRGWLDRVTLIQLLDPAHRPLPRLPIPIWQPSLFAPAAQRPAGATGPKPSVADLASPKIVAPSPATTLPFARLPEWLRGTICLVLLLAFFLGLAGLYGLLEEAARQEHRVKWEQQNAAVAAALKRVQDAKAAMELNRRLEQARAADMAEEQRRIILSYPTSMPSLDWPQQRR